MRKWALLVVVLSAAVVAPGCGAGEDAKAVITLDGSPRFPDDEGIVTSVSRMQLTLDGRRTYRVSKDLRSFSALDLSIIPLLHHKDQYVQVGVEGQTVVWIGRIANVVVTSTKRVFYVGELVRTEGQKLVMRDGTVLTLDKSVAAPTGTGRVQAQIDPEKHAVVQIVLQ